RVDVDRLAEDHAENCQRDGLSAIRHVVPGVDVFAQVEACSPDESFAYTRRPLEVLIKRQAEDVVTSCGDGTRLRTTRRDVLLSTLTAREEQDRLQEIGGLGTREHGVLIEDLLV